MDSFQGAEMLVQIGLPEPRQDGRCCQCGSNKAVTNDGRLCERCLRTWVISMNPGSTQFGGRYRTPEMKQKMGDDDLSPWAEIAVRIMEDG